MPTRRFMKTPFLGRERGKCPESSRRPRDRCQSAGHLCPVAIRFVFIFGKTSVPHRRQPPPPPALLLLLLHPLLFLGPLFSFFFCKVIILKSPPRAGWFRSIKVAFYRRLRHRPKENEIFSRFLVQTVLILVLEGSLANGGQILTAHDLTSLFFFLLFSFF